MNKEITMITPIVLLGNDLGQLWNNKQYHSGKILFGVINGLAIKTPKTSKMQSKHRESNKNLMKSNKIREIYHNIIGIK